MKVELQPLRLPDPVDRITKDRLHELQDTESGLALGANPEAQVLSKLGMEDGGAGS